MPVCQWCGKLSKKIHEIQDGRTLLRLCDMCEAEYSFRRKSPESASELLEELSRRKGSSGSRKTVMVVLLSLLGIVILGIIIFAVSRFLGP